MLALCLGVTLACATSGQMDPDPPPPGARGDTHTLTEADLASSGRTNLLDLVREQRPRWLQTPTTSGGRTTATVTIFIGSARAGDVSALAGIRPSIVTQVRYYDATEAQQRFPGRDLGPVIQVVLK